VQESGQVNGRVLLTGATGFVGGAVLEGLRRCDDRPVRLLLHRRVPDAPLPASFNAVSADLARPETLAGICEGVDTVLHVSAYIGDDQDRLDAVNARGTEALASEANAAGVRCFIYLSNAAVYGYAVHRNTKETDVTIDPATPISRSRARAEQAVLDRGGLVLRPLFIYGRGDTHFLPLIIRSLERFPFLINGGRARLSVISVDDLASVLIALATDRAAGPLRGVCHATDGQPVSLRDIVGSLAVCLGSRQPRFSLPFSLACPILRLSGGGAISKAGRHSFKHRLFLIAKDHYYDSSKLWDSVSVRPGPPLREQLPKYTDWYRRFLRAGRIEEPG
jgi:nucleoside-diphosphate-sugar epimerase